MSTSHSTACKFILIDFVVIGIFLGKTKYDASYNAEDRVRQSLPRDRKLRDYEDVWQFGNCNFNRQPAHMKRRMHVIR